MGIECRFCHRRGGHDIKTPCPETLTDADATMAKAKWQAGYDDGRARTKYTDEDPHYVMGWIRGDSAADEAENSVPWIQ